MPTDKKIREDVQYILEHEWIYYGSGTIVYESIIHKKFPHIDVDLLCQIYDDHRGWQDEIIQEYASLMEQEVTELITPEDDTQVDDVDERQMRLYGQ